MERTAAFTFAGLNLSIYIGGKDTDTVHLVCNNFWDLTCNQTRLLEEVADFVGDAIGLCTHKRVIILESAYTNITRFDISATQRDVPADMLYTAAKHALDKLSTSAARKKYPESMVTTYKTTLQEVGHRERIALLTSIRGSIMKTFRKFQQTSKAAKITLPDESITRAEQAIANKLTPSLAEKLTYATLLDYYLGDKTLKPLWQPPARRAEESLDSFVERTAMPADKVMQDRLDAFLEEESVGRRSKKLRHYLAQELAIAIGSATATFHNNDRKAGQSR